MHPTIHLMDESWIAAPVEAVAAAVHDQQRWARWWPGLQLTTTRDRGVKGLQWRAEGELAGSVEIWLEPVAGGVVLHHFLRLDPVSRPLSRRGVIRATRRWAWHAKAVFWQLKDELEAGTNRSYPGVL